jgi:SAM-dependent methyltransferase
VARVPGTVEATLRAAPGGRLLEFKQGEYGTLAERFDWISSYDNPSAAALLSLDRAMSRFYTSTAQFEYHSVASDLNQNLLDGQHLLQQAAILAARQGDIVLEFSCGGAAFAPYYKERGARYFGFDVHLPRPSPSFAATVLGSAYAAPFDSGWADLTISFYALEHVSWPELYLREMIRVTRPGGRLVLVFPDYLASAGTQLPSVRWGNSHGGVREKLARRAYVDAVQTYLEQRIVYRLLIAKLRHEICKQKRLRFMIQPSPSCLVAPWSIDTDAIYIASEEEVALYLNRSGCTVELRSAELRDNGGNPLGPRYLAHAFLIARRR